MSQEENGGRFVRDSRTVRFLLAARMVLGYGLRMSLARHRTILADMMDSREDSARDSGPSRKGRRGRASSGMREPRSRMHIVIRRAWITVGVVAAILGLGYGAERVTASPEWCDNCHQISLKAADWSTSPHTQVECPACHETPRPWYRFPETLAVRATMLGRNFILHVTRGAESTVSPHGGGDLVIPDTTCEQCHDPSRVVTALEGTYIDHNEHAERNDTCISCHLWTAHPDPAADWTLLLMEQCFDCHGRSETAQAAGTCETCHPDTFDLVPRSHDPSDWRTNHGTYAEDERLQCTICHEDDFCGDCHGVDMPHPAEWASGRSVHGEYSRGDRQTCATCHDDTPDFCTVCHHETYSATEGTWIAQHPATARREGASACMECHAPDSCVDCHTGRVSAARSGAGRTASLGSAAD